MTEIRTKEFLLFGGKLYPASGRPAGCNLEMIGEAEANLRPQILTPQMLLKNGFKFCAGECGRCSITLV